MYVFRSGSSTSDFYKITKDSHCSFEADSNQNNYLFGRHVADELDCKRSRNSQGYIDFSIAESRLRNKSAEICSGAFAKDRVSRGGNRLGENDINTTTGKSKKIETEMSKAYFKPQNHIMGSDQTFRFSLFNSTGSATSYATNQVFTTTANSSCKKQIPLPVCNVTEPRLYSGTAMVVTTWRFAMANCFSNFQNSNTIRCLQKGLGGVLSESVSRGSVVSPGVKTPYQCSEIVSHQTSSFNLFENVQSQINPFPSRQYKWPFIPDENGGVHETRR